MGNVVARFVAVSILDSRVDRAFVIRSRVPSGVNANALGPEPTLILVT